MGRQRLAPKQKPSDASKQLRKTSKRLSELSGELLRKCGKQKPQSPSASKDQSDGVVDLTSAKYSVHKPRGNFDVPNASRERSHRATGRKVHTNATGANTCSSETEEEESTTLQCTTPAERWVLSLNPEMRKREQRELTPEEEAQATEDTRARQQAILDDIKEASQQVGTTSQEEATTAITSKSVEEMNQQLVESTEVWKRVFEPLRKRLHLHSLGPMIYSPQDKSARLVVAHPLVRMRAPLTASLCATTAIGSLAVGLYRWGCWNLERVASAFGNPLVDLVRVGLPKWLNPVAWLASAPSRLLLAAAETIAIQRTWKTSLVVFAESSPGIFGWREALITSRLGHTMGLAPIKESRRWGVPIVAGLLLLSGAYWFTRTVSNGEPTMGPLQTHLVNHLRMSVMMTGRTAETVHMLKSTSKRWMEEHAKELDPRTQVELSTASIAIALSPTEEELRVLGSLEASSNSVWRMYNWNRQGANGWLSMGLPR